MGEMMKRLLIFRGYHSVVTRTAKCILGRPSYSRIKTYDSSEYNTGKLCYRCGAEQGLPFGCRAAVLRISSTMSSTHADDRLNPGKWRPVVVCSKLLS